MSEFAQNELLCSKQATLLYMRSFAQNERFFTPNKQCNSRSTKLPNKANFFKLFAQNKQNSSKWVSLVKMSEYARLSEQILRMNLF